MRLLAFDLGASSAKLYLGSYDGTRLALEELHHIKNGPIPLHNSLYWDIWRIIGGLNEGVAKARQHGEIATIGLDSYCNDFGLVDKNGELLTPVRCYRDSRTGKYEQQIYESISRRDLHAYSGNQIALFNTVMQLAAMRLGGQGYMLVNAHRILMIPDLLAFSMTGEMAMEYTMASVSGMYSFDRNTWSPEILSRLQIPETLFPTVHAPGSILGETTRAYREQTGAGPMRVVSVCQHDTASAYLSALESSEGTVIISSGTWSLVGTETTKPIINDDTYRLNIANEGGYKGHHRLLKNVMGLWLVQEVQAQCQRENNPQSFVQLEALARDAKPFQFMIDPDAPIFFSPGNMLCKVRENAVSGSETRPETLGQIMRCIMESLALKYRYAIECLETVSESPMRRICIVGGGSKDQFLCQLTADASGLPVIAGPTDASAIGNMLVQLIAAGELTNIKQAKELLAKSVAFTSFTPRNTSEWDERYEAFKIAFAL